MPDLETRTLVCVRPAMTTVSPSATSSSVLLLLLSISVPLLVKFTSELTVSTRIMIWPLFVTLGVTRSVTPVWMRSTATGALMLVAGAAAADERNEGHLRRRR